MHVYVKNTLLCLLFKDFSQIKTRALIQQAIETITSQLIQSENMWINNVMEIKQITFSLVMTGSFNYKGLYHNIEACTAGEEITTDLKMSVTTNTYNR